MYSTDFSFDPALEKQRDIFVFQCLVGCRISDLYRMTKRSIIDGAVEYMPRKTKDGNPVVVRVPLLTATKEILDKYKGLPGDAILPLLALTALSPGSIRQQENQSHARSMRCCHPILQERPLPAICTKMSRILIWSEPSAATKKAAAPSPATAKSTRI